MNKSILNIALVATFLIGQAFAADVKQAVSVFDQPSTASKQLEILQPNASVQVTGHEVYRDEEVWVPVTTSKGSGWVDRNALTLVQTDMGYINWPGKEHTWWIYGSLGPMAMSVDEFFFGLRASFGMDWFMNHHRRFFLGWNMTTPFSKEKLTVQYSGKNQRYNTYFTFGYVLLPPNLYVRYGLGLSVLAGANRHFMNKLGASFSAEFGYNFWVKDQSRLGLSFSYEYTGKSRGSVNFLQDLGHCVFGGCDNSRPFPSASVFALNLNYSIAP